MTAELGPALLELLRSFALTDTQKARVWEAFLESPDGLEHVAQRARAVGRRNGNTGAGLLLRMVSAGEHKITADVSAPRFTGWRFVRGTHSGNYVRDPHGTDRLPEGYGLAV